MIDDKGQQKGKTKTGLVKVERKAAFIFCLLLLMLPRYDGVALCVWVMGRIAGGGGGECFGYLSQSAASGSARARPAPNQTAP